VQLLERNLVPQVVLIARAKIFFVGRRIWLPAWPHGSVAAWRPQHHLGPPVEDHEANVLFFQRSTARSTTSSRAERCLACPVDATPAPWAALPETSRSSSVCLARYRLGVQG
jgi:hypothetical protein